MNAHEIIAKALEDLREHPELFCTGVIGMTGSDNGRMCVLGFLNKHAGRTNCDPNVPKDQRGADYVVYPSEAVQQGVLDADDPLVAATNHVAECAVKHYPATKRSAADWTCYRLNDSYGYLAVLKALECAEEATR